jgi:hypothetical protein
MKILINWPSLRQFTNYIRQRFTFLVLLCWPAIIWLVCRTLVWLTDGLMVLLGKATDHSFTLYLQPLMTLSALLRISVSWVLLLFILFSMAMGFTWLLRRFINHNK